MHPINKSRSAGVLLPIFALPSEEGRGDFASCLKYLDFIHRAGLRYWQILPINSRDKYNSPYASYSLDSINLDFISCKILFSLGLLHEKYSPSTDRSKTEFLLENLDFDQVKNTASYRDFAEKNKSWLEDIAVFRLLIDIHSTTDMYEWEKPYLFRDKVALENLIKENGVILEKFMILEFIGHEQWAMVKEKAREKNISIIGDLPYYPGASSVEVWKNPHYFLLGEDLVANFVSGVPGDSFGSEGQVWNSPVYNWDAIEKDGFKFITDRIERCLEKFDFLRLDHFRGYEKYFSIQRGQEANSGRWMKGPSYSFLNAIAPFSNRLLAEDLGSLDEDFYLFLKYSNLPGMGVLPFELPNKEYFSRVYYTGNHDTKPLLQYVKDMSPEERTSWSYFLHEDVTKETLIDYALKRLEFLCIFQHTDFISRDNLRINTPGTIEGNWQLQLIESDFSIELADQINRKLVEVDRLISRDTWKENLQKTLALQTPKSVEEASIASKGRALANAILLAYHEKRLRSQEIHGKGKIACYMSLEYLLGKSILNNLQALGEETLCMVRELVEEVYLVSFEDILEWEPDAGLGNGGLGRLAACLMDSSATMGVPLRGYGLRYEKGIFSQEFSNGFQVEKGDAWLQGQDPWGIRCDEEMVEVNIADMKIKAVPYDYIIPGYCVDNVNRLRLWKAEAIEDFDFNKFNNFEYDGALSERNRAEDITRVLYPNDEKRKGVVLRFMQQYFFAQATIEDLRRQAKKQNIPIEEWDKKVSIQLNDTHPVIAIGELIRVLVDKEGIAFKEAIKIVEGIFSYTNHTILKEALETWEMSIIQEVCPRTFNLIVNLDLHYQEEMRKRGLSEDTINRLKIINDGRIYMANLGIHASHKVNGVAEIHSRILKDVELKDFADLYPDKFTNVTNGVTPRRFMFLSNPDLCKAINSWIGNGWRNNLEELSRLKEFADNREVLDEFIKIKKENKLYLARKILREEGIQIDPNSIFDIQIKRIHEYKRQLLNAFHINHLYQRLKQNPDLDIYPRTFIFGGKSAPGYHRAKGIIKYINELARVINSDETIRGKIKVVYIQNYDVSWAENLICAADVSEQISTAGKEASGTGNMKFMMNGTVTLGTMDGANVEIFQEAGLDNNYVFGATVEELASLSYNPNDLIENENVKEALNSLMDGTYDDNHTFKFLDLYNALMNNENGRNDEYFILYDLDSYYRAQEQIDSDFRDRYGWAKKSFINLASSGKFTSDRTILEYSRNIWNLEEI